MNAKDIAIISSLIVVDPTKALNIIDYNDIESVIRALSILNHLLECTPTQSACAADGIINIKLGESKAVINGILLQSFFLIWDGLFLSICRATDITNSVV